VTEDATLLEPLLALLRTAAEDRQWLKAVFSHPDSAPGWEKLVVAPIGVVAGPAFKLVTHSGGRLRTRTITAAEWPAEFDAVLAAAPSHINVLARDHDWHARRSKSGRWLVSRGKPSQGLPAEAPAIAAHDRAPNHPLPADEPEVRDLFVATGLFGHTGQLRGEAAAKYRQVQHYIELLRSLTVFDRAPGSVLRIVDAGCGKAYLSLALYLFAKRLGMQPELHAVDREPGVIDSVAKAARGLNYERVETHASDIASFAKSFRGGCDLLVSLHACDTATDDAIAAGVSLGAGAIVVAPCCHHEVVAQVEQRIKNGESPDGWDAVLGSGLLRHRLADLLTDGLRAAALEAAGYRAEILDFVDPDATDRNLMIRAEKRPAGSGLETAKAAGLRSYRTLAGTWRVRPSVERILEPDSLPG
jgi:Methyltransferase domain